MSPFLDFDDASQNIPPSLIRRRKSAYVVIALSRQDSYLGCNGESLKSLTRQVKHFLTLCLLGWYLGCSPILGRYFILDKEPNTRGLAASSLTLASAPTPRLACRCCCPNLNDSLYT
jgi:hypothetical protein